MVPILGTLVHGVILHTFYVGFSRLVVCFMVIPWLGGAETRVLGASRGIVKIGSTWWSDLASPHYPRTEVSL